MLIQFNTQPYPYYPCGNPLVPIIQFVFSFLSELIFMAVGVVHDFERKEKSKVIPSVPELLRNSFYSNTEI